MKRLIGILGLFIGLLFWAGCSDFGGGGGGGGIDNQLVNSANEAWVMVDEDGVRTGWILKSNGTLEVVYDYGVHWQIGSKGEWSVRGNTLTIDIRAANNYIPDNDVFLLNFNYSISGNTLNLAFISEEFPDQTLTFTKTRNVTIGTQNIDNRLVNNLARNEAWILEQDGRQGLIFMSDGTVLYIFDWCIFVDSCGNFRVNGQGMWSVIGNSIAMSGKSLQSPIRTFPTVLTLQ